MLGLTVLRRVSIRGTLLAAALPFVLVATEGRAQGRTTGSDSTTQRDSSRVQRLPSVITTATRSPALQEETAQRVEVVSRDVIARTPSTDFVDAIKKHASIDVIQYPGLSAGVGMRGYRPETSGINKRTLLLVDGRPAGATNLALLDLVNVERVEVMKGPASSLYGSSAMSGTINIVTRNSRGPMRGELSAAYGSFGTSEFAARAGGILLPVSPRFDGDVAIHVLRQQGDYRIGGGGTLRSFVGRDAAIRIHPDGTREPVRDLGDGEVRSGTRYGYYSGAARLGVSVGRDLRVDARGDLFHADDVETPGDIYFGEEQQSRKNVRRHALDLAISGPLRGVSSMVRAYSALETGEFYDSAEPERFVNFASETRTSGIQLQVSREGIHGMLSAGIDLGETRANSRRWSAPPTRIAPFSPDASVATAALFTQGRARIFDERVVATLGARLDRLTLGLEKTPFRPDVNAGRDRFLIFAPSAGVQASILPFARLHASAGRGFVAPDAFGRAGLVQSPSSAGVVSLTVGNSALSAESSVTIDGGMELFSPNRRFEGDFTWFMTSVKDRITRARGSFSADRRPTLADGNEVGRVETSVNAGDATMLGWEARVRYDLGTFGTGVHARLIGSATRLEKAQERTRAASIDTARFAGVADFRPEQALDAFLFGAETKAPIRNVARLTATLGFEVDGGHGTGARLSGRYVGTRRDTDATNPATVSDIEYPPFMVLDASVGSTVLSRYRVDLLVSNLTDENYYEKRGFNLAGRAFRLRATATIR